MSPSLSQFTTHPRSLPPGPSQGCHSVGFSPGKSPPTALIRIENNNTTFENCCSTIHDNYSPDNSIQSLPRNITSPGISKSTSLRFMPYKKPSAAAAAKAKENDQDLALFGPVPSADSFSLAFTSAATSGPVTPPPPITREGDLTELVLDDEMVFQELDCITNSLHLPYSPPLSPTITTTSNSSSSLDDDLMGDDFILFP
ncbi:Fumarate hydratase [Mucor velutinosus]|uniref:Fumarate hydratase n=1 Tax=Mucor velutinosus TaxID=708070 RepID=A0AAN7D5I5_9FUNG|nr:Fumarate hydratase [Mucor velutinosus]